MSITTDKYQEHMDKTISVLKQDLNTVRAGRANAALLDQIVVDYYGTPTPVKNMANISVPDPRTLMISPFDPSSVKEIEKAIMTSNLGINPSNDGRNIRLVIPVVTEERRKELCKQVKKYGEDSKVAVRNCRRDAIDKFKAMKKNSEITEDDIKDGEKKVQTITDKYIEKIDKICAEKEKEIMTV